MEHRVPRVRDSSYFPSLFLEPRRRAERAFLAAGVQEAYVHGVSTRKVEELVKALGMGGISKSRVSELCEQLDEEVERFRSRPLEGSYPYVWLDATYVKARQDKRVAGVAVVIAVGVKAETSEQEVWGLDVGPSEDGSFCLSLWLSFLRALFGSQGPLGREVDHQRRPSGPQRRYRGRFDGSKLAALSSSFYEERVVFRAHFKTAT